MSTSASSQCYQSICNALNRSNISVDVCNGGSIQRNPFALSNLSCCQSDSSTDSAKATTLTILASVFGACLAFLLIGLIAGFIYMTNFNKQNKDSKSQLHAPSNPLQSMMDLTLVITDIESSTTLWETVDAEAMNRTLNQHHALIRKLLKSNNGQEEATEGDSFIMSFSNPQNALDFSLSLQSQLMELDYDDEVLKHPVCAPVWMKPSSDFVKRHGMEWKGQFGLLNSSLLVAEVEKGALVHSNSSNFNEKSAPLPTISMSASRASKRRSTGNGDVEESLSAQQTASNPSLRQGMGHTPGSLPASPGGSWFTEKLRKDKVSNLQRHASTPAEDVTLTFPSLQETSATGNLNLLDPPRLSISRAATLQQHLELQQEKTFKVSERIGQRISSVSTCTLGMILTM
jgi:hypothetical protein